MTRDVAACLEALDAPRDAAIDQDDLEDLVALEALVGRARGPDKQDDAAILCDVLARLSRIDRELIPLERRNPGSPRTRRLAAARDELVMLYDAIRPDGDHGLRGLIPEGRYCFVARGRRLDIETWSSETGIPASTIRSRLEAGWKLDDVVTP